MTVLDAIREVQIPLLAAMLLGGCAAKLTRMLKPGADDGEFGATVLFPMQMRQPLTVAICLTEGGLGLGLIITAGRIGAGAAATAVRIGALLLFVVATCALIELRQTRPEAGCGCFGDFSTAPVSGRSLARSAMLAAAAVITIGLPPIEWPQSARAAVELIVILFAELIVIGLLSPEIGEGLIRLGYSEPCELRVISVTKAAAALHRSKTWRRYASLVTTDEAVDSWRELCWHYLVYPAADAEGRPAELVFAVFLQYRRPAIRAALVDSATGAPLPWPGTGARRGAATGSRPAPDEATPQPTVPSPAPPCQLTPRLVRPGPARSAALAGSVLLGSRPDQHHP